MKNLTVPTPLGILKIDLDHYQRVKKVILLSGDVHEIKYNEQLDRPLENLKNQIDSYFSGDLINIEYPVNLDYLSNIDKEILRIVNSIPFGRFLSYKTIAEKLTISPRRVGLALSRNPAPIIIPCHRVIMSNGKLGGYLLGVKVKKWLIEHERSILYRLQ